MSGSSRSTVSTRRDPRVRRGAEERAHASASRGGVVGEAAVEVLRRTQVLRPNQHVVETPLDDRRLILLQRVLGRRKLILIDPQLVGAEIARGADPLQLLLHGEIDEEFADPLREELRRARRVVAHDEGVEAGAARSHPDPLLQMLHQEPHRDLVHAEFGIAGLARLRPRPQRRIVGHLENLDHALQEGAAAHVADDLGDALLLGAPVAARRAEPADDLLQLAHQRLALLDEERGRGLVLARDEGETDQRGADRWPPRRAG